MGWLTGVSSRLTMDLILFIDTCKSFIVEWENYGGLVYPWTCAAGAMCTPDSTLFIDTCKGYIPEWENYWFRSTP
jgi:hypothetical protein